MRNKDVRLDEDKATEEVAVALNPLVEDVLETKVFPCTVRFLNAYPRSERVINSLHYCLLDANFLKVNVGCIK